VEADVQPMPLYSASVVRRNVDA